MVDHAESGPRSRHDVRRPSQRTLFRHLALIPDVLWPALRVVDAAVVCAAGLASYFLRHDHAPTPFSLATVLAVTLLAAHIFAAVDLYDKPMRSAGFMRRALTVTKAWVVTAVIVLVVAWATKTTGLVSRLWIGSWFVSGLTLLLGVRVLEAALLRRAHALGYMSRRVALLTSDSRRAAQVAETFWHKLTDTAGLDLCGVYAQQTSSDDGQLPPTHRGGMETLERDIASGYVQDVVVVTRPDDPPLPLQTMRKLQQCPVNCCVVLERALDTPGLPHAATTFAGLPALQVASPPLTHHQLATKRSFDLAVSSGLLLALSPLMLLTALAVRLESPGPVFFRQQREGFAGERFRIWKFRSMRSDCADADGNRSTARGDPRVTRVGAFIRRTSIDELPQLFNVLGGEMSLVGPRPHALGSRAEGRLFWEAVDDYHARHRVKPGITGWAQVHGWRGATETHDDIRERVQHDIWYVDNWSLKLDVKILLMTAFALSGEKALA